MQNPFQEIENNSILNLKIKKAYVKKSRKIRRSWRWWKARNYIINPSDWENPFLEIVKKKKDRRDGEIILTTANAQAIASQRYSWQKKKEKRKIWPYNFTNTRLLPLNSWNFKKLCKIVCTKRGCDRILLFSTFALVLLLYKKEKKKKRISMQVIFTLLTFHFTISLMMSEMDEWDNRS